MYAHAEVRNGNNSHRRMEDEFVQYEQARNGWVSVFQVSSLAYSISPNPVNVSCRESQMRSVCLPLVEPNSKLVDVTRGLLLVQTLCLFVSSVWRVRVQFHNRLLSLVCRNSRRRLRNGLALKTMPGNL